MQCLLIDDDLDDQEVFVMILEKINNNITCATANTGVAALAMLEDGKFTPDYIFLDMNMPKMNGIECLTKLKELPQLVNCKIFMYSTTAENSVVQKINALGAVDFIVKPASPADLEKTLSRVLSG